MHTHKTYTQVLTFDHRGIGQSGVPPARKLTAQSSEILAQDALALIQHVWSAESRVNLHVYGASMGGMVAQKLALLLVKRHLEAVTAAGSVQRGARHMVLGAGMGQEEHNEAIFRMVRESSKQSEGARKDRESGEHAAKARESTEVTRKNGEHVMKQKAEQDHATDTGENVPEDEEPKHESSSHAAAHTAKFSDADKFILRSLTLAMTSRAYGIARFVPCGPRILRMMLPFLFSSNPRDMGAGVLLK
jgi:hypothetical protein